jgi:hypothetical protein
MGCIFPTEKNWKQKAEVPMWKKIAGHNNQHLKAVQRYYNKVVTLLYTFADSQPQGTMIL